MGTHKGKPGRVLEWIGLHGKHRRIYRRAVPALP
jgi:hypothetical protein